MTVLERVARAIWEADPTNPPYESLTPGRFSWNLAQDQARAALSSVQDVSDVWRWENGGVSSFGDVIDAILSEHQP